MGDEMEAMAVQLYQRAESAVVDLADIERVNVIADNFREYLDRRDKGLTGILGEEELARREAEVAAILAYETTSYGAFESVEELSETIRLIGAQIGDAQQRPFGFDDNKARFELDQLVKKQERIAGVQNAPRADSSMSAGQMAEEATKSIAAKIAAMRAG